MHRRQSLYLARRTALIGPLILVVLLFGRGLLASDGAGAATPKTVVSIEFDDGWESSYQAGAILGAYGMAGTFFILSGFVGDSDYMTWPQLHTLAAEGDEIAGHTIDHTELTTLSSLEQEREICNDRVNLINEGFEPTDFAYPNGAYSSTTEAIAQSCGYNSARSVAGVLRGSYCPQNPGPSQPPSPCVKAETIPPLDPYATRTPGTVESTDTPATIESWVTQAEDNGGGWVQIVFHQICDGVCPGEADPVDDDATPQTLTAVASWLQGQASAGVSVEPINQVVGGAFQPAVSAPPALPVDGSQLLQNGNLEANASGGNVPSCFQEAGYGTNSPAFTWNKSGPAGSYSETVNITSYSSGDAGLVVDQDQGTCSPSVFVGQTYLAAVSYESTVPAVPTLWYRNSLGSWNYWTSGQNLPAESGWTTASFTTPAVPSGATAISFGLTIDQVGSLSTGNYSLGTTTTPTTVQNPLLESSSGGVPNCWEEGGYGTNTTAFSLTPNGPGGGNAENVTMSSYSSGDAKLVTSQLDASCAPAVTPGTTYTLGASYESTVPTAFVVYYETASGSWNYWTSGQNLPAESGWTTASFTTPAVPSGATAISFGLTIDQVGSLSTGNYSLGTTTTPTTVQNPLLESSSGGVPNCWEEGGYGTNTTAFSLTPNGPGGGNAENVTMSSYSSGDAKLVTSQLDASCAPAVTPGTTYTLGASYESTVPTAFVVYYETASGSWNYWTSGQNLPAESGWTTASFTTPAVPSGATAISFGLTIDQVGSLSTGNYSLGIATS